MPLQDILNAISAQADSQISETRSAHQKNISELREASERRLAKKKQELATQKEKKKIKLKAKAETHAEMHKKNVSLRKKRELLDKVYVAATAEICSLPDDKIEELIRNCLKQIEGKGSLYPSEKHASLLKKLAPSEQFSIEKPISAKGGFLFTSSEKEQNFTFEHLIQEWLRPRSEISISKELFM
ncbi:hypothetical protein HN512_03005 [Candidatus Peregrinibacteria bacterium]|jgi:V/A-type H+-transporting ATPase subunit E|nr:hypothetical protein [Candidatus Peregrinibacteria bacterium]MBT3598781.1 hypothetical protein [Candidatus Peregrinibacteria bacterium]MBT4585849.1 hypothetical protein [Candidatus Peregrinibacteria bacterium]MBT6731209.1 hypothetical protein [Candidatus Peregrinibacteria bacterium]MBT7009249.1 hypothetical protein [Candidatus Peregrinibacteria bacterium]